MKICVTAIADGLDSLIDPRFGRCPYFVIVDLETMRSETVTNPAASETRGAGIHAARIVASKEVRVLITGNVGPNAFQALLAAGIEIMACTSGTVKNAIEKYKLGELQKTNTPTVRGHFGIGGRRGQRGRQW